MAKEEINFQGSVYCKVGDLDVTVLLGNRGSARFTKVICPYLRASMLSDNPSCSKQSGKCGVYMGAYS